MKSDSLLSFWKGAGGNLINTVDVRDTGTKQEIGKEHRTQENIYSFVGRISFLNYAGKMIELGKSESQNSVHKCQIGNGNHLEFFTNTQNWQYWH